MAIYAEFDEAGACIQIATNSGWSQFGDWVESIKGKPLITKLWEHGECLDIPGLRSELKSAIADGGQGRDVAKICRGIVRAITAAGKADFILVTNGIIEDDGDDDEHDPTI